MSDRCCLPHIYDPEEVEKTKAKLVPKKDPFVPSVTIHPLIEELKTSLTHVRRHLHTIPEIGFKEVRTSRYVADMLRSFANEDVLHITESISKTGIIAWFYGTGPAVEKEDYCVMLRADMDGLPIGELETERNKSYKSTTENMHACGHDGHMSILLHATKVLLKEEFRSKIPSNFAIKLCFQPSEESGGGAKFMCDEGILENTTRCGPYVNEVYGLHLWTYLPLGTVLTTYGSMMAASDRFYITIKGEGGHGAVPNGTKDVIMIGSQLISQLQTVVSRNVSPLDNAVITVGTFEAGYSANIIADKASLSGTTRSFSRDVQKLLEERISNICKGIEVSYDCEVELKYIYGYPATCNDAGYCVDRVLCCGKKVCGTHPDAVNANLKPTMGAEDFSFYLNQRPGCFFFVGACPTDDLTAFPHHKSVFDFNEDALAVGSSMFVQIVEDVCFKHMTGENSVSFEA